MQNALKITKPRIAGIFLLFVVLILVRVFQEQLFYDPFLKFFKETNYAGKPLPYYNEMQMFIGLLLRYVVNTVISLGIITLFFMDRALVKLSAILYSAFFVVLTVIFFWLLSLKDVNLLVLFYVRRFLIQPLFLILFIPAFYYQRKTKEIQ